MQDSLYVSLSSQIALEKRMDTLADNVANMNTVGFRATGVRFQDLVSGTGDRAVSFASAGNTYMSSQAGGLRETSNPYDFAIQGDGWFGIDTPAGTVMTRDGRFTLRDTGQLVTLQGYPVLDNGGAPIQLDPNDGPPQAGADGSLRQDGKLVGAIGLYQFDPGENATRFGNSGVIPSRPPEPIVDRIDVGVAQGFVEESNVNPVLEMSKLIMIQRTFEDVAAAMRSTESTYGDAIKTLGSK